MSPARRPAQAGDDGILDAASDRLHGLEVAFRGDREAGLDDVDAHLVQEIGDLQLLFQVHGGAGALLAVAQRGVEDQDAIGAGARGEIARGLDLLGFLGGVDGGFGRLSALRIWPRAFLGDLVMDVCP